MTRATWGRVKDILHQAMQLDPEQRSRFLDDVCTSDPSLRSELESLLSAERKLLSQFLVSPRLPGQISESPQDPMATYPLAAGQLFAQRFQLIRKLGEGGMGQVWLAEQISPVRRHVALKLIRAGMYDDAVLQRFQSEQQSLAMMDHSAIAKVFEAGVTPLGQPYFVMEYVPGQPITEYCDGHELNLAARLELFIRACEGIQHAHQKAIIHRDLKPANILVVDIDGKPEPRIIDFGLAKIMAPLSASDSLFTHDGLIVGTPGYMSPEQADPAIADIDTRTDVYSLGVVLYVLLAGLRPFQGSQHEAQLPAELLGKLREEEPPLPSARVAGDRSTLFARAKARGSDSSQLVKSLRGDLDAITMKAIAKDRSHRYGSASEIAADIRRYLNHEPVTARTPGAFYHVRKYARRHRIGVGIAAGLLLVFAAFTVVQTLDLRRITRERDRANHERDRATRITDFMTGMFKLSDPNEARGNSVTAREILDKASHDLNSGLAKDPEAQSQMMQVMARTYVNLGLYARAYELAHQALDLRQRLLGPTDPKTLDSKTLLGWILGRQGKISDAEKIEREALADETRMLGAQDPLTLETMDHLAVIVEAQGHYEEQEKLERSVIAASSRTLGPESPQTLRAMNNLGTSLWNQARFAEAEREYRQVLQVERRVWGPDHPETLIAMGNLALAVQSEGRLDEAGQLYREALSTTKRVLGPEHPGTVRAMENLATLSCVQGRFAECEKLHRETLQIQTRTLGPDNADTLFTKLNLADSLLRQNHLHEAETLQRETLATQLRVIGPRNPDTLLSESDLSRTLIREGHYSEAEKMARDAFEAQDRDLGPEHPDTLNSLQLLGMALAYQHRYPEAASLFQEVIAKQSGTSAQGNHWLVWYDFACAAAAASHADIAFQYLQNAVSRGFDDVDILTDDVNLAQLHKDPRFQQIIAGIRHTSK